MAHANHGYPIMRPGIVEIAEWYGDDHDLVLGVGFHDETGQEAHIEFTTRNTDDGNAGQICLPTSVILEDGPETSVGDAQLVASLRMATLISKSIPGSAEWANAFTSQEGAKNFQTAVGNVKATDFQPLTDTAIEIVFQEVGHSSRKRTVQTGYDELGIYQLAIRQQMQVIPGAIWKEYPSCVHDYSDGKILTASQRVDIADYVRGLSLWM